MTGDRCNDRCIGPRLEDCIGFMD
ncbi:hypothetical protein lerEdw1_004430, partial [Lerista edwardsae]